MVPAQAESPMPLALVTGSAHRLGKTLATALARRGFAVVLHYYHSATLVASAVDELRQSGYLAYAIRADLTDPSQIKGLFRQVAALPHPLQVLVNSAGTMVKTALATLSVEQWDATLALNLRAPFLCSQEAARLMTDQGGLIINLTDAGLSHTWTAYPDYQVSKAGLAMLTRVLARSLAPRIRVNAIAPGLILKSEQVPAEDWARLIDRLPARHAGDPEDIAKALIFLVDNDYITGQTLVVDGGYQLIGSH